MDGRSQGSGTFLKRSATCKILGGGHGSTRELCLLLLNTLQQIILGVPFLHQHCFTIVRLSFTVIFVSITHFFPPWINLSFLSLRCHKFPGITHRINVPLCALRKRDWHPTVPRQKPDQTWLHGVFDRMLWPTHFSDSIAHSWLGRGLAQ